MVSSQQRDPQQMNNNPLIAPPQPQIVPVPNREFYNNPPFQSSPYSGAKPLGWFGTNHINWVSHRDSELDKNKLATQQHPTLNK